MTGEHGPSSQVTRLAVRVKGEVRQNAERYEVVSLANVCTSDGP